MNRFGLPLAAVLTSVGLTLSACGGGVPSQDELADQLVESDLVTEDEADCAAEKILDSDLSDEQLEALGSDDEDSGLSAEDETEAITVVGEAVASCLTE